MAVSIEQTSPASYVTYLWTFRQVEREKVELSFKVSSPIANARTLFREAFCRRKIKHTYLCWKTFTRVCVFICFFSSVFVCIFVTVLCMCDLFYHFYFSFVFLTFLLFCYLTALALIRINIYNLCCFFVHQAYFLFF